MKQRYGFASVLVILLTLVVCVGLAAQTTQQSQGKRVTLALNNVPLKQAIEGIAKQANYQLLFSDSFIPVNRIVSIDVKDATVNEALTQVLAQTATDYRLTADDRIILVPSEKPPVQGEGACVLKGEVTDSKTGKGIPGAAVFIKALNIGASTAKDGSFSFTVPEEKARNAKAKVMARIIGYKSATQTVTLSGGLVAVNFVLEESTVDLDEVVVSGSFSQVEKRPMTYSKAKYLDFLIQVAAKERQTPLAMALEVSHRLTTKT